MSVAHDGNGQVRMTVCMTVTMRSWGWMHGSGTHTNCDVVLDDDGHVVGVQERDWKGRGTSSGGGIGTPVVGPENVP